MIPVAQAWARLGIDSTDDKREVKRAYGRALKAIDPDSDPQAFVELREAYETALQWGAQVPYWEQEPLDETPADAIVEADDPPGETEAETEELLGEDWWESWRPEPPAAADGDGLREAYLALDALLFEPLPPPAERIVEAGEAVMTHPELARVDRLAETERWMAEAIAASTPRSDPLLMPAIARFEWDKAARDWRRHHHIATLLGRRDDLLFLKRCLKPGAGHRRAADALMGRPPRKVGLRELRLARDVRKLLDVVESHHPSLDQDFDADSLSWWRGYFHGRHLPLNFLTWMLAAPALLTLCAVIALEELGWSPWFLLAAFPLAVLAVAGLLLGKAELDARARKRSASRWSGEAQTVGGAIEWIAGAALLLPPIVALLPNGPFWGSVSLTASLAVAGWGLRFGWVEPEWAVSNRARLFLPIVAGIVGATALAMAPAADAVKLVPPLLALCWFGSRGYAAMQLRLQALPRTAWLALLGASLACICLAAWPLLRIAAGEHPPLWLLLVIPSAIVTGHCTATPSPVDIHVLEWPLRLVALVVYFATGMLDDDPFWLRLLAAVATYGLLYSGIRVGAAILTEVGRREREQS